MGAWAGLAHGVCACGVCARVCTLFATSAMDILLQHPRLAASRETLPCRLFQ